MMERALTELLYGKGAHANPLACVEDVPLELAGRRVEGFPHSIGQLVAHMNYWMEYEVRRMAEKDRNIPTTRRRAGRWKRLRAMSRGGRMR
jgi:hypothetical protein